jgi:predicted nuclease with TOPRIM domain
MFSNLSQGHTLYILDTNNGVKFYPAKIDKISPMHPMYQTYTAGITNGMNMGSVVDITVTLDGSQKEFTVSSLDSVSSANNYILADNKEAMIAKVDGLLQSNRSILDNIEKIKSDTEEYESILKKLNPTFAKESAMDEALTKLTERVDSMQGEFGSIKGDVSKVLEILTKTQNN